MLADNKRSQVEEALIPQGEEEVKERGKVKFDLNIASVDRQPNAGATSGYQPI